MSLGGAGITAARAGVAAWGPVAPGAAQMPGIKLVPDAGRWNCLSRCADK